LDVVRTTATRVGDALHEGDRLVLVLGGDCTVGIGTIAGVRATQDDVAVAYFDLHSDLNTPASATDGALDWMALGHMLGIDGAEPTLVAATDKVPLLEPRQVVLFAQSLSHATRFERAEIERLGLARIALEESRRSRSFLAGHKGLAIRPFLSASSRPRNNSRRSSPGLAQACIVGKQQLVLAHALARDLPSLVHAPHATREDLLRTSGRAPEAIALTASSCWQRHPG
jgi:Arginase family